jgi:3-keto-5-aminohexanoate cleavage enzyme
VDVVVIEAALNGGRSRGEHPAIPITPDEVAVDARRCRAAGASVIHIHSQDADGGWNANPAWYAEAIRRIRNAAPGLLVSITSLRPARVAVDAVLAVIAAISDRPATRPDLISINLGHIVAWPRYANGRVTEHYPNDYADIVALLDACRRSGIGAELGLMDLGFINNAVTLRDDGHIADDAWFLIELDSPDWGSGRQTAPATSAAYDMLATALAEQFPSARWAAHGVETGTWSVIERALAGGAHVRVGLEDTITMPDGSLAASNAEQVERAVSLARALGREPASAEQAMAIVGI